MNEENYGKIATLFEELSIEFKKLSEQEKKGAATKISKTRENMTLSEELFFKIVNIYVDETQRKAKYNLKRKSGVLLAKNANKAYIEFLSKSLPDEYTISEIKDSPTFLMITDKKNVPKSVIRFITDLGYQRGAEFGKKELTEIKRIAQNLRVSEERVHLIIISMVNSLDESDVRNKLKDSKITNQQLIKNKDKMKTYVSEYIKSFSRIIPDPAEHIHVLSYTLHPNRVADELCDNQKNITDYNSVEINDIIPKILKNIVV